MKSPGAWEKSNAGTLSETLGKILKITPALNHYTGTLVADQTRLLRKFHHQLELFRHVLLREMCNINHITRNFDDILTAANQKFVGFVAGRKEEARARRPVGVVVAQEAVHSLVLLSVLGVVVFRQTRDEVLAGRLGQGYVQTHVKIRRPPHRFEPSVRRRTNATGGSVNPQIGGFCTIFMFSNYKI